jgi:crotonobetainyl-CoA:carnitine CoA-transferase CaiB-like acyl-CoA transferase
VVTPSLPGGPLAGFRVVDFTENMAGPFATMILGDQGADVIKVESLRGDVIRRTGTGSGGMSAYFANLNRSKRSLAIDLLNPQSARVLERLLDGADVVVQSFRANATRKLGLDAATVRATRPKVVHVSIIGFGPDGPFSGRAVYDHVIQALSGMAALQADGPGGEPRLVRHGLVDKATGHVVAETVCAALLQRVRTGTGAALRVNMLDVALAFLWPDGMMDHTAAQAEYRRATAASTFRLTPTADGHLALVVLTDAQWASLRTAFSLPAGRPGSSTPTATDLRPGDILRAARSRMKEMTTDAALALLAAHDVPCAPVVALADVADNAQVVANDALVVTEHPVLGSLRQPRPVPRFPGQSPDGGCPAPVLGQDTWAVLAELGWSTTEIEELSDAGVIAGPGS